LRYDGPFVEEAGGAGFMPADRNNGWIAPAPLTSARPRCFALGHLHLYAKAIDGVAKMRMREVVGKLSGDNQQRVLLGARSISTLACCCSAISRVG
jgi:hypothetical protein